MPSTQCQGGRADGDDDAVPEAAEELVARGRDVEDRVRRQAERAPAFPVRLEVEPGDQMALGDVGRRLERGRDGPVDREQADEGPEDQRGIDEDPAAGVASAQACRSGAEFAPGGVRRTPTTLQSDRCTDAGTFSRVPHPAIGEAQHHRQEDDDDDQVEHGERGAVADIRAVAIDTVDVARHGVGRATRAAGCHIDDDVRKLQLEDDAQDQLR